MKRKIKSSDRRKWIVGGSALLVGAALLTTGTATYVVGIQKLMDNANIGVTVDTAENKSVEIKANISDTDKTIHLGEKEVISSGVVRNEDKTGDMQVTFSSIVVTYGKDYLVGNETLEISFAIPTTIIEGYQAENWDNTVNAKNSVTDADADKLNIRTGETYTYIDTATINTSDLSKPATSTSGQNKVLTWTDVVVTFKWGTYFDGESPATYYNGKYAVDEADKGDTDKVVADMATRDLITQELNLMHDTLDSKNLVLTVSVAKKAA